jgi:branched-chain amino acid transport system permease protein
MVSPEVFNFTLITNIAAYNFFGGLGHFFGPIVGAGILTIITEFFRSFQVYERIAYAIVVVLVILFLPEGVISLPRRLIKAVKGDR